MRLDKWRWIFNQVMATIPHPNVRDLWSVRSG